MASSRCGLQVKARSNFFVFATTSTRLLISLSYIVSLKRSLFGAVFLFIEVKVSETLASYLRQRVSLVEWSDRLKYFFSERKYF